MRRAPIVVAATVVGTAGVLLFKPLAPSALESAATASPTTGSTSTGSQASGSSAASTGSSATPSSAPSASASASSGSTAKSTTVDGDVETDRYGNTQVRVTIKAGKITAVTVLQYNDGDPRSAQISQDAIPTLRQEVLQKQSAAVDAVSGATYTSNAYKASLQSALDKAGYTAPDGSKATTDLQSADADIFGGH